MTTLPELLARIEDSPDGPSVGAFFDYDGTVIGGFSAAAFYRHRLRAREIGPVELTRTFLAAQRGLATEEEFGAFLDLSLAAWAGKPVEEMEALGRRLFKEDIASRLHSEVWEILKAHRAKGHTIVLASSATRFQVEPMADEIDADYVVCTPIEVADGIITGRVGGRPAFADGKADAVRDLALDVGVDLDESFAYSNGGEDVAFLSVAAHPCCVEPDGILMREALERGWPVLRCVQRGGTPGVGEIARTVGFYGAMAGAAGVAAGVSLLNGLSRETLVELTGGVGSDVGLALAGVQVEVVEGTEHLWSARPCVFVFNHQSKIDPILLMKLLRGGFTGVAKREAANVPGFGQFFKLAGVAFVDRGNPAQTRKALEPAVSKVRDEGVSLVIAPEGTRSATPRLGRFKKGAFHIAMQAEVPMVPIVIRNAWEVMWRGAQALRPGTVEVVVKPPIDTSAWSVDTIEDHVADVRGIFLETLENWPTARETVR